MIVAPLLALAAAQGAVPPAAAPAPSAAAQAELPPAELIPVDQIRFRPSESTPGLDALKDDHSMEAVVATLRRLGIPFERRRGELDTGLMGAGVLPRIRQLPPTEPFVLPMDGWITINLITGPGRPVPPPDRRAVAAVDRLMAAGISEASEEAMTETVIAALMPRLVRGNTGQEERIRAILREELAGIARQVRPGIRARMKALYLRRFTRQELEQLARNAESPVGRKLARELPGIQLDILGFGRAATQAAVQAALPRILARMRASQLATPQTS